MTWNNFLSSLFLSHGLGFYTVTIYRDKELISTKICNDQQFISCKIITSGGILKA